MTESEVKQLSEQNYQIIRALDIIEMNLICDGEIISNERIDNCYSELVIKNDNIIYKLLVGGNDTCKSITWERG